MKIYGVTIISSDGDILVTKEDGTTDYAESMTKLFADKQDCIDYAVSQMKVSFGGYDFEDGEDENGETESDFEADLKKGKDICIQGPCCHTCFEFFIQDMGIDIINRDDYIVTKLWCDEDVRNELRDNYGLKGTDEQVYAVENTGFLKNLGEVTDGDWEIINDAIRTVMEELKRLEEEAE